MAAIKDAHHLRDNIKPNPTTAFPKLPLFKVQAQCSCYTRTSFPFSSWAFKNLHEAY